MSDQRAAISPKPRPSEGAEHVAYIDALRGWAFLLVLFVHIPQCVTLPESLAPLQGIGNYGVQLFYVISALTLFMSFEARSNVEAAPIKAFYLRRLFRIAPLFWTMIVAQVLLFGLGPRFGAPEGIGWRHIAATAAFVHGWAPSTINSVVPGGWSIAVEMNFYLLLPLCYAWCSTLRRALIGCGITLVLGALLSTGTRALLNRVLTDPSGANVDDFCYYWLPRQFVVFTVGFVLFAVLKLPRPPARIARFLPYAAVVILAVLAFIQHRIPLMYFAAACAFAFLAYSLAASPNALLVNSVSRYVGKVSYSAYLMHFLVVHAVARFLSPRGIWETSLLSVLGCYLTVACLTVGVSTITYHLIEVPGQNLGRRLISRLGYARRVTS